MVSHLEISKNEGILGPKWAVPPQKNMYGAVKQPHPRGVAVLIGT